MFYDDPNAIDQFDNITLTRCRPATDNNGWYAFIDGGEEYSKLFNPDFSVFARNQGDAVAQCADKIRDAWRKNARKFRFWHGSDLLRYWEGKQAAGVSLPDTHTLWPRFATPQYEGWSDQTTWEVAYAFDNDPALQAAVLGMVRELQEKEGKPHSQRGPVWGTRMTLLGSTWAGEQLCKKTRKFWRYLEDQGIQPRALSTSQWEEIYSHFKIKVQEGV